LAAQTIIDAVKSNLPAWRTELTPGWDDAKIGTLLDANCLNVFKVVRLFWLQRVSDLTAITDVTDVNSTRPLSQTYQHAQDMLHYWDRIAGVDATSVTKIKRRYHRRHHSYGLSDYAGVYGRVD
jgi:hypothetical protein